MVKWDEADGMLTVAVSNNCNGKNETTQRDTNIHSGSLQQLPCQE